MLMKYEENAEYKLRIMVDVSNCMESMQLRLNDNTAERMIEGKQNDLKRHDISSLGVNGKVME